MTAEEIKDSSEQFKMPTGWLREIAYQLALLNEREQAAPSQTEQAKTPNRVIPTQARKLITR